MIDDEDSAQLPPARRAPRPPRRVFVDGLELMASVGIYEVEKRYEQRILVSVVLEVRDDYDGASDRLEQVFDYGRIVDAARALVTERHYLLIETLAERLADACLAESGVLRARVRIEKPDIVPGCRSVGIEIDRSTITD